MFKVITLGVIVAESDTRLGLLVEMLGHISYAELLALEVAIETSQRELIRGEMVHKLGERA